MIYSEKDKIIYELRFDKYIRLLIFGTFKKYLRAKIRYEQFLSLNEIVESGIQFLELLIGDEDVVIEDRVELSKIENIFSSPKYRKAFKPLTPKEKSAAFLCYVLDFSSVEAANYMNYKSKSSVNKLLDSAKKKARKNKKEGEKNND